MRINSKKAVTLASLVIYIVLFTVFTAFVMSISSNMNERLFSNRGEAINYSSLSKLQYNIETSSMDSNDVTTTNNTISFSNGDNYIYDSENKVVYKNDGILCLNVDNFSVSLVRGVNTKKVTISLSLNKYLNQMNKTIIACVEGA